MNRIKNETYSAHLTRLTTAAKKANPHLIWKEARNLARTTLMGRMKWPSHEAMKRNEAWQLAHGITPIPKNDIVITPE